MALRRFFTGGSWTGLLPFSFLFLIWMFLELTWQKTRGLKSRCSHHHASLPCRCDRAQWLSIIKEWHDNCTKLCAYTSYVSEHTHRVLEQTVVMRVPEAAECQQTKRIASGRLTLVGRLNCVIWQQSSVKTRVSQLTSRQPSGYLDVQQCTGCIFRSC